MSAHLTLLQGLQIWRPFLRLEQGQAVGGPVTRLTKLSAALRTHLGYLSADAQDAVLQSIVTKLEAVWGSALHADGMSQAPAAQESTELNACA